ncbi:MAG TPA: dihydrofolate reductase family protein [Nocardioidaceae bacterium]|nr:dihydrofolate reductase family protein [Nocardioidaceae bacterium]
MPEVVVDFITSLDGFGAAEGCPDWWGLEGPEYLAWLGDQREAGYTVLMGATTYRVMSELAAQGETGTDALADMPKIVFPVITGRTGQDRIYDDYPDVSLDMISSRTFDGRIQLLEYVPKVLAGAPGATVSGT